MASTQEALPYSVSSSFNEFAKLQGAKNYATWKKRMRLILLSHRQWGVVAGTIVLSTPVDAEHPTEEETKAKEAWEVREKMAFMEISSRMTHFAKNVLGNTQNPKVAWGILEKRFGAKLPDLVSKLQLAAWDGGDIYAHRDYMVNLRIQMADAGMTLSDVAFYYDFITSLPPSLDLFVTFCNVNNYNVDSLCDTIAAYEMHKKLRAMKFGNPVAEGASDESGSTDKKNGKGRRKRRDLTNVTCYACGKKGHIKSMCQ